jgi:hypothetical protein
VVFRHDSGQANSLCEKKTSSLSYKA